MKFGEVLKEVRKYNGDSLRSLAEKVDIHFTYVDKVEKGISPVSKNFIEKMLKIYPRQKTKLTKSYLEETLPDEMQKEIGLKIEDNFLNDMKILVKLLDEENQRLAFLYIIERLEFTSMKNGTYEKVKGFLEDVKNKINKE